jgi:mono/diheme cytochrome c family protein
MKKIVTLSVLILVGAIVFVGCGSKSEPGKIYMPDMGYSRAYETYSLRDSALFTADPNDAGGNKIFYNNRSVAGTIKRGELYPYTLPNDSNGYKMSAAVVNPIQSLTPEELKESQRLFNINCAICHGEKGAGNGPIASSGKIGGIANLTLDSYVKMTDGTMFHSITYGKNLMGSYASQLDAHQRWMIVKYIRTLQPNAAATAAVAAAKDSTGK